MTLFDAFSFSEGFDLTPQAFEPIVSGGATPNGQLVLRNGDEVLDRAGDNVVAEQR